MRFKRGADICKVENCHKLTTDKGYCRQHYYRSRTRGLEGKYTIVGDDAARLRGNCQVDKNGCWIWIRSCWNGYGKTILKGKAMQAHRASWKVFVNDIPKGRQVNHKCHVRSCINPSHLYLGDQKQNMEDMKLAGRERKLRGSENGSSKLKESDIVQIRDLSKEGSSAKQLAKTFNTCLSNIRQIVSRNTWKHVG